MDRNGTVFAKIREMNKSTWEYVKFVSQATNKNIPAVLEEMAELYAKTTGREFLMNTYKEEFGSSNHKTKS